MKIRLKHAAATAAACVCLMAAADNIIDEVAWVVGDEPIYKSEIEEQYMQSQYDNSKLEGNPYCVIPERMAVEKLYLNQAKIDTIEAPEAQVQSAVNQRINFLIQNFGSKDKVEEYYRKPMTALREQLVDMIRTHFIVEQVQHNLTKNVKSTPSDVKKFFATLPEDSIPYIPMQVEAQIITLNPVIPQQEIDDVKARLRDFSARVNSGESDFSTLAIMYSEDGSAMQGGELGFHGKADFVPEFSNVAFNLNDPKKVSKIVETEYGYHIIQLIEKRGDQINCRHILLRPKVDRKEVKAALERLDTLRADIESGKFKFDEAVRYISQDKDTKNNRGVMQNSKNGTTRFEMQELPQEVARQIENMQPGDISQPFEMKDAARNRDVVAIVKLTGRSQGHRANLSEDYNLIKQMYEAKTKEDIIKDWVEKKIKDTFVRIEDGWRNCNFQYQGWIK